MVASYHRGGKGARSAILWEGFFFCFFIIHPPPNCGEVRIDPLEKIKGIGPVIKRKLNEGGVFSFAQLGALTPAKLEEIVGEEVRRLADEEELIRQAQELAKEN